MTTNTWVDFFCANTRTIYCILRECSFSSDSLEEKAMMTRLEGLLVTYRAIHFEQVYFIIMSWLATTEESSPLKMALTVPRWVQVPRWPKVGAHRCRDCTSQLSSSATVQPGTVQLSGTAPRLQVQNLQLKMRKILRAPVETRVSYNRVLNPKMWLICPIWPFSPLYPPLLMAT